MPEKKGQQNPEMVNRDALCTRNVLINTVDLILLNPQCCKSRFLEDRTKNCILEPRKPMSEDQQGVLLGVANRCRKFKVKNRLFKVGCGGVVKLMKGVGGEDGVPGIDPVLPVYSCSSKQTTIGGC